MRLPRRAKSSCGQITDSETSNSRRNLNNYGSCKLERPFSKPEVGELDSSSKLDAEQASRTVELSKLEILATKIPCLGIMLALMASLFLGSAGMLVKMTHSVHGIQVAVFRAYIQLAIYSSFIIMRRLPLMPEPGERLAVFGRAFLGSISITFSYCALKLIPLGDATTIRFSLPIWTLIISYLVLNESCSIIKIIAVVVSISGVVLIAKPDDCIYAYNLIIEHLSQPSSSTAESAIQANSSLQITTEPPEPQAVPMAGATSLGQHLEGCLLALSSSIFLSMSLIALRLCKKTPAEVTIFWLSVLSILVGSLTLVVINEWRFPTNWLDFGFIILNGVCGALGQWFITSALKIEQSGVISLARTFDIQVAFLYSAFLLHEKILVPSIIGSLLVSMGVLAVIIPGWLDSRRAKREQQQQLQSS